MQALAVSLFVMGNKAREVFTNRLLETSLAPARLIEYRDGYYGLYNPYN
jgi:hypothetical protein